MRGDVRGAAEELARAFGGPEAKQGVGAGDHLGVVGERHAPRRNLTVGPLAQLLDDGEQAGRLLLVVTAPSPPSPAGAELTHYELTRSLMTLANAGPLSSAQIAEEYGLTTAEAREVLTRMVSAGLLERIGQTRGTRYVLPGGAPAAAEPEAAPEARTGATDEQRERVLRAAGRQALTNEIVRDLLGVDADAARTTLAALVAEGLLDKQGQRRGTRYVLAEPEADQQGAEPEVLDDPELHAVWELAADRSINNGDVRKALRVSANHAQDLLRALYERNLLDRRGPRGERRYSRRE